MEAHRLRCPAEPVRIALTDAAGRFEVEVTDTCSDGGGAGGRGGNGGQPDDTDGGTAATGQPGDAAQPGDSAQPGDAAQPGDSADLDLDRGLGLAVIAGLADDVRISETPGGISITMSWPAHCA